MVLAACATVNAIIRREKINEVDGTLVLDCNAVLLKMTESMAELKRDIGLGEPGLLYQAPNAPRATTGRSTISAPARNSAPDYRQPESILCRNEARPKATLGFQKRTSS